METIILIAAGILALVILFFKARRLFDTVKGSGQSPCDCGNCSSSCAMREIPDLPDDAQK
jgi:heterodisulfide reductase subunit C